MPSQAIMTMPLSRPKVHRPPVFRGDARGKRPLAVFLATGLTVLLLASWMSNQRHDFTEMKTQIEPAQRVESTQPQMVKQSDTIVIKEGNQAIIGQLARIPVQNKAAPEVQTVTSLDKEDGKELLSIVNKY